jgi:hypothetical protein
LIDVPLLLQRIGTPFQKEKSSYQHPLSETCSVEGGACEQMEGIFLYR